MPALKFSVIYIIHFWKKERSWVSSGFRSKEAQIGQACAVHRASEHWRSSQALGMGEQYCWRQRFRVGGVAGSPSLEAVATLCTGTRQPGYQVFAAHAEDFSLHLFIRFFHISPSLRRPIHVFVNVSLPAKKTVKWEHRPLWEGKLRKLWLGMEKWGAYYPNTEAEN